MNCFLRKGPEYTLATLFIILFYISFIQSYRLLVVTAIITIIYAIIASNKRVFINMVKSVFPFIILLILPILLRYIITKKLEHIDFTIMIIGKVLVSSIILGTVISKYSPLYFIEGVLNIGLPPIFNRILVLTFRYFHMINEDVEKSRQALISRGISERKGLSAVGVFGEWIGGFFLKSSDHSEMVFNAMKSRGFKGETKNRQKTLNTSLILRAFTLVTVLTVILIIDRKM